MQNLLIRAGAAGDIRPVLDLWKDASDDVDRAPDTAQALLALMDRDPGALIVAVAGARVVGSVVLGWDGWRGHIYRLAVDPSYRREGLGAKLLQAAEERARNHRCVRVDAIVRDENELAHRLWRRAGYDRQTRWSRWVKQVDG